MYIYITNSYLKFGKCIGRQTDLLVPILYIRIIFFLYISTIRLFYRGVPPPPYVLLSVSTDHTYQTVSTTIMFYTPLLPIQYQSLLPLRKDISSESLVLPLYVIQVPRSSVYRTNSFPIMTFTPNIFAKHTSRFVPPINPISYIQISKPPMSIAAD